MHLKGLWILVAAVFLSVSCSIADWVLAAAIRAGNNGVIPYIEALQYIPFLVVVITLCGWYLLAFCSKKADKPDA